MVLLEDFTQKVARPLGLYPLRIDSTGESSLQESYWILRRSEKGGVISDKLGCVTERDAIPLILEAREQCT